MLVLFQSPIALRSSLGKNKDRSDPMATSQSSGVMRNLVGILVLFLGMGGILFIAWFGVKHPPGDNSDFDKIFTTLVAVSGGWVSTVIVFYFSREGYQAAQNAVNDALKTAVGINSTASVSSVQVAMVPLEKLMPLKLAGKTEAETPLQLLCEIFTQNPTLTRVPIFQDDGSAKYIVHDASFYRFMSDRSIRGIPVVLAPSAAGGPVQTTMDDFLQHNLIYSASGGSKVVSLRDVVSLFATCTPKTTLGDAQASMVAIGAQDIVVTQDGKASSPLIGLLTTEGLARSPSV